MTTFLHRYPFHESSGLVVSDVVGGQHATLVADGDEWQSPGIQFNGTDEYVELPAAVLAELDLESLDHTIALWWNCPAIVDDKGLFSIGRSDADTAAQRARVIVSDGGVRNYFWDDAVTLRGYAFHTTALVNTGDVFSVFLMKPLTSGAIPTARAWRHYHSKRADATMTVCNGPESSISTPGTCSDNMAIIGASLSNGPVAPSFFPGKIWDFRIYSGLITDTDEMLAIKADEIYSPENFLPGRDPASANIAVSVACLPSESAWHFNSTDLLE